MRRLLPLLFILTLAVNVIATHVRVHPRDVTALTLHAHALTTGVRHEPHAQLQCIGDARRCSHVPALVRCVNQGWDGLNAQWRCETGSPLAGTLELDQGVVECEGWSATGDTSDGSILAGSCAYRYTLRGDPPASGAEVLVALAVLAVLLVLMVILAALGCTNTSSGHGDGFWFGHFLGSMMTVPRAVARSSSAFATTGTR
jgi:hypothetical protein